MKSPFPGMDPFIEGYGWSSFHLMTTAYSMQSIAPVLPEGYIISSEIGITADDLISGKEKYYKPDIGIMDNEEVPPYSSRGLATATITPPKVYVPLGDVKQRTLTIRTRNEEELITAIEVLSPTNKSSTGLVKYRRKREELIRNGVNVVEIDLLRGGTPPFLADDWPQSSYRFQAVEAVESMVGFWSAGLDEKLPTIGIPLLPGEASIALNLQHIFENVYKFSTYNRSLKYNVDLLKPPADFAERKIIEAILANNLPK